MTEEHLFGLALQANPVERAALLDRECAGHPELRSRIEALLAADAQPNLTLDSPINTTGSFAGPSGSFGVVIAGKYRLVELIGEGGMGEVWLCEQSEPVRRRVALKLIRAGMDSRQVIARFEAERQALAVMDHPNIAKVLDGGLHEGRPYFVMELVKGVPITQYCDAKKLTPRERLELFVPVCQAIQHAHQKGIIHRDIKPSNVLIAPYDDKPVPKVIDFGLAKATGVSLTDASLATNFGGVVGTPQYMSPEQANLNNLDVDTRSDIYSLGVLLYELLTGSPPFKQKELEKAGMLEILRVIREEEPPKPSTKLSTAEALPSLSADRGMEPKKLTGLLRKELDWVVMKALEKDRTRRYETANGFAADVLRYLGGEPVLAHPPSAAYRLRKWYRKNRVTTYLGILTISCVVAVVVNYMIALSEIRKERDLAVLAAEAERQQRSEAERQRQNAEAAQREAADRAEGERRATEESQTLLKQAIASNDVLRRIFLDLNLNREDAEARPLPAVLGDRLVAAVSQLDDLPTSDPLIKAHLQADLAVALITLGSYDKAAAVLEGSRKVFVEKLGPDHLNSIGATSNLASAYHQSGHYKRSLELFEECYRRTLGLHGRDHPTTLRALGMVALAYHFDGQPGPALKFAEEAYQRIRALPGMQRIDVTTAGGNLATCFRAAGQIGKAIDLHEEMMQLHVEHLGRDHISTLTNMNNLANAYMDNKQTARALELFRDTLKRTAAKLGPDHPSTLQSQTNLALCMLRAGQAADAIPILEDTLQRLRSSAGADHPYTNSCILALAAAYPAVGRSGAGISMLEQSLRRQRERHGNEHPRTLMTHAALAKLQENLGRIDTSLMLYRQLYEIQKRLLPANHNSLLMTTNNLGACHLALGQYRLALPLFEECERQHTQSSGPDSAATLLARSNLARSQFELGQRATARKHFEDIYLLSRQTHGLDSEIALDAANNWAHILQTEGKLEQALPILEATLEGRRKVIGENHPDYVQSVHNLAGINLELRRVQRAIELFQQAVALSKTVKGPEHIDTLRSIGQLARSHFTAGRTDLAIPMYEDLLKIQEKKLGDRHPETQTSMISLAVNYDKAGRSAEALPLFERALAASISAHGRCHLKTFDAMSAMALHHKRAKRPDRAIVLFEEFLPQQRQILGESHPKVLTEATNLAITFRDAGQFEKAITMLTEIDEKKKDNRLPTTVGRALMDAYVAADRKSDAVAYVRQQLEARRKNWPANSPNHDGALASCGKALLEIKADAEAEALLRECLAIREKEKRDAWTIFNAQSMLGEALVGQKKFGDAEPLLIQSYEGLKASESQMPAGAGNRILEAINRLIILYTAMERPDDMKKWQDELAKHPAPTVADKK